MTQRNCNLAYGLGATALLGLSFMGWTHQATAQNDTNRQTDTTTTGAGRQDNRSGQSGQGGQTGQFGQSGQGGMMGMTGSGQMIAASNNSVFVLRGNTLYKFRANDLSLDTQKTLPMMNDQGGAGGRANGAGGGNDRGGGIGGGGNRNGTGSGSGSGGGSP
jgi:hypothetical protein